MRIILIAFLLSGCATVFDKKQPSDGEEVPRNFYSYLYCAEHPKDALCPQP